MVELDPQSSDTNEPVSAALESVRPPHPDVSGASFESEIPSFQTNEVSEDPGGETDRRREQIGERYGLGNTSSLHHKLLLEVYSDGERVKAKVERLPKNPEAEETHIFDLQDGGVEMINFIEEDVMQSHAHSGRTLTKEVAPADHDNVGKIIVSTENIVLETCALTRGAGCTVWLPVKRTKTLRLPAEQLRYAVTLFVHRIGKHTHEVVAEVSGMYDASEAIPVDVTPGVLAEGMCRFEAIVHFFREGADLPHEVQFWESRVLTVVG